MSSGVTIDSRPESVSKKVCPRFRCPGNLGVEEKTLEAGLGFAPGGVEKFPRLLCHDKGLNN